MRLRIISAALLLTIAGALAACSNGSSQPIATNIVHQDITATVFWVGEPADSDNGFISNTASAWDDYWQRHFGGVDDPTHRQHGGLWPATFTPKENPFYFALPYDDLKDNGEVKVNVKQVPWYDPAHPPRANQSILKNRWIKVTHGGKTAYAQWEDVGPFNTDDVPYVFGTAQPSYKPSGLDLSPAMGGYLDLNGLGKVAWQFVDASQVPAGPWREIITTSPTAW